MDGEACCEGVDYTRNVIIDLLRGIAAIPYEMIRRLDEL